MQLTDYVKHLLQHCGLDESQIEVSITEEDDRVLVQMNIPTDEVGLFIGHRGEALASFQRMCRLAFQEEYADKHIVMNINDYREERIKQLQEKAREVGEMVLDSGRPYRFNYLSSYERFVVHSILSEDENFSELQSSSEGEGRDRRLVVRLKEE